MAQASNEVPQLCTAVCSGAELHPQIPHPPTHPPRDPLRGRDRGTLPPSGVQNLSSSPPPLPRCFLINKSIDHWCESPNCSQ